MSKQFSLVALDRKVRDLSGTAGPAVRLLEADDPERISIAHDLAVARLAYRVAKTLDDLNIVFTSADADAICAVLSSRVVDR